MSALDSRIEIVRAKYDLSKDDFWQIKQNGAWVAKHAALEVAALKAGIRFDMPVVIEHDAAGLITSIIVQGTMGDHTEWSIGETNPTNYHISGKMQAYPWAMSEKRAKDRVILKLIGIHGLVYSDAEADFSAPATSTAPANGHEVLRQQLVASTAGPPPAPALDANGKPYKHGMRIEPEMRDLWTALKNELDAAPSLALLRLKWYSPQFKEAYDRIKPDWQDDLTNHCNALIALWNERGNGKRVPRTLGDRLDEMGAQEAGGPQ